MSHHRIEGVPGRTDRLWAPPRQSPFHSARHDTLPMEDEEREAAREAERRRRARGFGFNPQRERDDQPDPLLWEGDGA